MTRVMSKSSERLRNSNCLVYWPLLCALGAGLASGCGSRVTQPEPEARDSGVASFTIRVGKAVATALSRAEVVITGSGMAKIRQDLTIDGDTATGTVRDIPAGTDRLFTLNGYDSSGSLTYTGSATADVIAGQLVTVTITMRRVTTPSGTPRLRIANTASAQRPNCCSSGTSIITGEIENTGEADATNVTIDLRARNINGAAISDSRATIGTVKKGENKLFTARFSGTCWSKYDNECGTKYISRANYTLSYSEGDPISGRITIPD